MIRLVEAKGFRCLRYVRCEINAFEILVGANASGKSTLLDVIRFLGDLVSKDFEETIKERSDNLKDLIWQKEGDHFELAIEMEIPTDLQMMLPQEYQRCRYEVSIGIDSISQENSILSERVLLVPQAQESVSLQRLLFPEPVKPPDTLLTPVRRKGVKTVINKVFGWK